MFFPFSISAEMSFQADSVDSISHFRAIPIYLTEDKMQSFTRHSAEDRQGYLWSSGSAGLLQYDGYINKVFDFQASTKETDGGVPYLFNDSKGNLWVANTYLYRFNPQTRDFQAYSLGEQHRVTSITEDSEGNLWLFNARSDVFTFNLNTNEFILKPINLKAIDSLNIIYSSVFDASKNIIWFTSDKGVYGLDIAQQKLLKVNTKLDKYFSRFLLRDIAIDEKRSTLWVGTPKGALQINTNDLSYKLHVAEGKLGSLPTSDVSVTFVDSANNVWLGLEKEGLCVFKHNTNTFLCLTASLKEKYKLPVATVEDITEDSNGSLWLSMNQYGLFRITPDLEKFINLENKITSGGKGYFPNLFDGIVRDNNDIWIASDGGGINIFNHQTGALNVFKSEKSQPNTLYSNSVVSLTEDENGYIWAGTWAGGLSKIDPVNMTAQNYLNSPDSAEEKTIAGNNVFVVVSDKKGGIWLSVWGVGLQYYNIEKNIFTNFLQGENKGEFSLFNTEISHLELYNEKLWITGKNGLETLDIKTKKFKLLLPTDNFGFTFVWVESLEEVWVGTFNGLILFNAISGKSKLYNTTDGLPSSEISYIKKDAKNRVWVATSNGLSVLDLKTEKFTNFTKKDGMTGNQMSFHGEFISVGDSLYVPSKTGITIINTEDMPNHSSAPKTLITNVEMINSKNFSTDITRNHIEIPIDSNNVRFEFVALNYIFPEYNHYKYKLTGLQEVFLQTNANERFARFTNLPAGDYTFEVYGSNSSGVWDAKGDRFSFTILPAWWTTWWAYVSFIVLVLLGVVIIYKWRFTLNIKREHELQEKVNEKTIQLQSYATELKSTSDSLFNLNSELESRVDKRTAELQLEINERKLAESKLFHMAFHDSLTELPNREWITQHIEKLLDLCKHEPAFSFGTMFLDGDRFKQINDTLGHIVGDQLLKQSSKRLTSLLEGNQHLGRLGGDEFTVIIESYQNSELEKLAQKIISAFEKPFNINNHILYFNFSIGIVECDYQYTEVPEVLRNADIAMYRAKELGRATYQFFDEEMQKNSIEAAELESGLRAAIKENQFHLVFQPIINLESGIIASFEALIRWQHPTKGLISPLRFIPIAEETGLIWEIGKWVLHESCKQTKLWHDMALDVVPSISVNLSTNQLRNNYFLNMLDDIIKATGIRPRYLKLELTESVLIENNHELKLLYQALRERKIDLAIDDFGTGYSSLAYLNEIPVDYLKLDRGFIEAIDKNTDTEINEDAMEVVKATISLAKSLRKKIVAEGIETQTQLTVLIENGCDFAQGFFMSKPVSAKEATNILKSNKTLQEGGVNISKEQYINEYRARSKNIV